MNVVSNPIHLGDILSFEDLKKVKIRFNVKMGEGGKVLDIFDRGDMEKLLEGQYWNYEKKRSFSKDKITVGFARYKEKNLWLLFHVGKITKDLNTLNGIGYEHEAFQEYDKYIGRLVVRFKNQSQNLVRNATSVMEKCEVVEILPRIHDNDYFPGYDNVNISWDEMSRVTKKEGWRTALQNQKGVYLISDISNGKMYVGSAYGENMLLGRWESYISTGHGGNKALKELNKKLGEDYIKKNFRYSILDIFKATIPDQQIIEREAWWKDVLQTRKYGYNHN